MRDAAQILKVSEKTIYRWLRQGVIPSFRFQGQYRFDRKELQSWARYKRIGSGGTEKSANEGEEVVNMAAAVRKGGIHYKIEGETPQEIYRAIAGFFPFMPGTEEHQRGLLAETLIEREALASTGVGHGLAIPHPRHPRDWGFGEPVVGVFFLDQAVDFGAFDGEPVFALLVSLCATVKGHLQMLAQVSHLLHSPETQAYLRGQPNRSDLLERIAALNPQATDGGRS